MVIFNLYTLVDGIFVAHYEGDTALASINVASPYVTTIFSIGVLFAIGSSTVMSIYRGANEERKMHEVFTMNTITISCVALCISILSFINSHHITEFLGANEDVFFYTDTYIKVLSCFSFFYIVSYCFEVLLKADGFPQKSIMGVKTNYPWHEYSRILSLGLPDCISEISPGIMITVFNYRINQLLGTDGLVTFTVLMYIYNLVLMVMVGTSQGTQPLVSYYYGRSDKNAVSTFHKYARVLVSCAGILLFLIVEVFSPNITAAFIPVNTENYFNTIIALRQFSFVFLIMGHVVITSGYMVALEEPRKAFVLSISRGILFVLLSLFVCTTLLKENGIWISCTVSEIFCLGIALYDLKTQRKI